MSKDYSGQPAPDVAAMQARIAELEQKLCDSLDAERAANLRIAELERMQETLYLLGSEANANRLMESIAQLRAGKAKARELIRNEQSKTEHQAAIEAARQGGIAHARSFGELAKYDATISKLSELIRLEKEHSADLRRQLAAAQAREAQHIATAKEVFDHLLKTADTVSALSFAEFAMKEMIVAVKQADTTALDTLLADKERETMERCAMIAAQRQFGKTAAYAIRALMTKEKSDENNT